MNAENDLSKLLVQIKNSISKEFLIGKDRFLWFFEMMRDIKESLGNLQTSSGITSTKFARFKHESIRRYEVCKFNDNPTYFGVRDGAIKWLCENKVIEKSKIVDIKDKEGTNHPLTSNYVVSVDVEKFDKVFKLFEEEYERRVKNNPDIYDDFWGLLNDEVVEVARELFKIGKYKPSVLESFKHFDNKLKELNGEKLSENTNFGVALINKCICPKKGEPAKWLVNKNVKNSKYIQEAYCKIIIGIYGLCRNEAAHTTKKYSRKEAIHNLHLASLLFDLISEPEVKKGI